jgi:hypothetical protein
MNSQEMDRPLEQGLSGDPPGQAFRARVLLDSTAAFTHHRRMVHTWRLAARSVAAVVIGSVSFLLGRYSMGPLVPQSVTQPVVASAGETVAVPNELVAWLQAAQLFRQLGMEDRMARAVERAGRLLPVDGAIADGRTLGAFAADRSIENREEQAEPTGMPGPYPPVRRADQILAQAFGD